MMSVIDKRRHVASVYLARLLRESNTCITKYNAIGRDWSLFDWREIFISIARKGYIAEIIGRKATNSLLNGS